MAGGGRPQPGAPSPLPAVLLVLLALLPPLPQAAPGSPPQEAGPVSCLAPAPSLAWYLDRGGGRGGQQGGGRGGRGEAAEALAAGRARRLERPLLNCSATDPETGRPADASVLLDVQFQPELVKLEAASEEEEEDPGGLLVVLLVLVQAHPPATITWVDQDGRTMVNTSHFLIVEAKTYPWPTGHAVQLQLHNRSLRDPGTPGGMAANASLLLPGLLAARVELPLLALVVGAAGAALCLLSLLSCLVYRKGKKAAGPPFLAPLPPSDSSNLKPRGVPRMPRANISLPANLQLNDLTAETKGQEKRAGDAPVEEEEERALSEPENSLVLVEPGLGRFPMVGYIYRASSMSSDEIWL